MTEKPKGKWPDVERRSGRKRRDEQDRRRAARLKFAGDAGYNPGEQRKQSRRSGGDRRDEEAWQSVPLESVPAMAIGGERELHAAAVEARTRAHARYSRFKVGAALETVDQAIVTGCNIENATYGLTMCAERVALVKALSDGHEIFTRIVVVADTESPTPPCGSCRQLLWEYCGDIDVILANPGGVTERYRLSALLPLPFDRRLL
jgi:cytidine deaminase